ARAGRAHAGRAGFARTAARGGGRCDPERWRHRRAPRPGRKAAPPVLGRGESTSRRVRHMSDRFTGDAGVAQNSPMAEEAQQQAPEAETAPLVFEQPLNERMRTFLRLDFLYSQALYHNEMQSQWGSRAAMGSLLDIL